VRTVEDLTSAMLQAMGSRAGWVVPPAPTFAEAQTLSLNSDLAAKAVGWRPRLDSAQAIAWTAEWYGRHAAGEAARTLCLEQIERYETLS
jgi:CDP-glucose 4,6-dehydratase